MACSLGAQLKVPIMPRDAGFLDSHCEFLQSGVARKTVEGRNPTQFKGINSFKFVDNKNMRVAVASVPPPS